MKVSIIVPVYNTIRYLERCIDSILCQTYCNIELMLVDDGSTDGSAELCNLYSDRDKRVKVIHKENGGQSSARNLGLKNISGEYVMFVDSDDYITNDIVDNLLKVMCEFKCDIVCCNYMCTYDGKGCLYTEHDKDFKVEEVTSTEYIKGMCKKKYTDGVGGKLFRNEMLQQFLFQEGRVNEDFLLLCQVLFEERKIMLCDFVGYYYYQRNESTTHKGVTKALDDAIFNCNNLIAYADREFPELKESFVVLLLSNALSQLLNLPVRMLNGRYDYYKEAKKAIMKYKTYISKCVFRDVYKFMLKAYSWFPACIILFRIFRRVLKVG